MPCWPITLFRGNDNKPYHTLDYNPRLDGLRAIAALSVFMSHYAIPGFRCGQAGVDIFFVLSGYLITQVLIRNTTEKISLGNFYWRRFLRLAPALIWLCIVLGLFAILFPGWINTASLKNDIASSLLYVGNWTRAFSLESPMYLGNCWSLAVEEQFYILWPIVFFLVGYDKRRIQLSLFTALFLFLSIGWSFWFSAKFGPSAARVFNGFDTRCSGLLFGCSLALLESFHSSKQILILVSRFWLAAVIVLCILISAPENWSPASGLFIHLSTVVLITSAYYCPENLLGRFLSNSILVSIGKASYSLYLWHYPIMLILKLHGLSTLSMGLIGIPLSLLAAFLSYKFIESPALRLRHAQFLPIKGLGYAVVSFSVLGIVGGMVIFFREYVEDCFSSKPITIEAYDPAVLRSGDTFNVQPNGESCLWMKLSKHAPEGTKIRIGSSLLETFTRGRFIFAFLPRSLLSSAGKREILLVDSQNTDITTPVSFEIIEK